MKIKITFKLYIAFGLILGFLVVVGVYSMFSLSKVNQKSTEIAENYIPRVDLVHSMNTVQSDFRISEYKYLLATTEEQKQQVLQQMKQRQELFDTYSKELKNLLPEDRKENLNNCLMKWNEYLSNHKELMNLVQQGKKEESVQLMFDSLPLFDSISDDLLDSATYIVNETNAASKQGDQLFKTSFNIEAIIIIAAIIISVVSSFLLSKMITGSFKKLTAVSRKMADGDLSSTVSIDSNDEFAELGKTNNEMIHNLRELIMSIQNTSQQVAASSQELTASAEQSADVTNDVANSIMEIANASAHQLDEISQTTEVIKQISLSIEGVANNASISSEQANHTSKTAREGSEAVKEALVQMNQIEEKVSATSVAVSILEESSKEIGQILGVISDIASQTNLLALNAAIEAARAGEHGKGFAVVANEVKKLAEQSQEATEKIGDLIKTIQVDTQKVMESMQEGKVVVTKGSEAVNAGGNAFLSIVELVEQMAEKTNEITGEIQEVSARAQQIVASVDEIDNTSKEMSGQTQNISAATEEQSASTEQIASSSKALAVLAQTLDEETKKFTL
ncbi:methyl-accepting chemotaxis protein [Bacillus massiliigorillae]|uniref:methyl-accepting chemotaxis protein n=1 Tax=Bacillus massiliigorillae TaxID=1243664 RepID=UPI0006937C67|nr:methyl-accepting chemotaxis protein [Bacillus massiliigorillae]